MDSIPTEVLGHILSHLDKPNLLNASVTCTKWQTLLDSDLPQPLELHITLDSTGCNAAVCYRTDYDTSITICQCHEHHSDQNIFLRELFRIFGDRLRSLTIEDSLYNMEHEERVTDLSMNIILRECGQNLEEFHLSLVDLRSVRPWTLAQFGKFHHLTTISFEDCKFPAGMSESLLLRILTPSFHSLESITFTNNELISDKFGVAIAKKCHRLEHFVLNSCRRITAVTAVAFCEALVQQRISPTVNLYLQNTAFDPLKLQQFLLNPLLSCGPCWIAQGIVVNIGFDRNALLLENKVERSL
uniref:F-box domain-containing protein n=1 Tax=Acrobeloides nanus TaxID=290746 RepID=A0A914EJ38_9BILA